MSEKTNKSLSTEPYKGVRDFYPEDQAVQNYIFKKWREVVESFGYVEYNTSILEPAELYRAKSGEEIVNEQTYSFIDRGEREVTLRPEMTPSVARLVAAKKRELSFPLRWYSIQNFFRYERPQRGRVREFWQLNCDMFGASGIEADAEVILLAYSIIKSFGARDDDFKIRINSRKLIDATFAKAGIIGESAQKLQKLIDKKAKIDDFEEKAGEIIGRIYDLKFEKDPEIDELLTKLQALGITNAEFDPDLVRGFDYYTGMVFEIFDTNPENSRSIFGGGRYDDILDLFGEEKVAAVGFAPGDVTMKDFLESRGLIPPYTSPTRLYLCNAGIPFERIFETAQILREGGIHTAVDMSNKKIGDQIKKASKDSIAFIAVIGEDELNTGEITIKHLASGKEEKVSVAKAADHIKNFL